MAATRGAVARTCGGMQICSACFDHMPSTGLGRGRGARPLDPGLIAPNADGGGTRFGRLASKQLLGCGGRREGERGMIAGAQINTLAESPAVRMDLEGTNTLLQLQEIRTSTHIPKKTHRHAFRNIGFRAARERG